MILGQAIDHCSSATMPAAAITPAWRIPPPTTLPPARLGDKGRSPHTTEPIGAASPLLSRT